MRDEKRLATAIALLLTAMPVPAAAAQAASDVPDFSGFWARQTFGLEPPLSGRGLSGPLPGSLAGNTGAGGDYTDPLLKPDAAEVVKRRSEILKSGLVFPNQCYPYPPALHFVGQPGGRIRAIEG